MAVNFRISDTNLKQFMSYKLWYFVDTHFVALDSKKPALSAILPMAPVLTTPAKNGHIAGNFERREK